jgi:chemotaxis protein MotA
MIFFDYATTRHRNGKSGIDQMGRFTPAFGTIGTLLGLIIMPGNRNDPDVVGPGMAGASIAILYGAVCSRAILLPLAEKLGFTGKRALLVVERGTPESQSSCSPS